MGFLQNCSADEERTDAFSTSLLGLIGDFADIYKRDVRNELLQEWVQQAIQYGRQRGSSKSARSNAGYAAKVSLRLLACAGEELTIRPSNPSARFHVLFAPDRFRSFSLFPLRMVFPSGSTYCSLSF